MFSGSVVVFFLAMFFAKPGAVHFSDMNISFRVFLILGLVGTFGVWVKMFTHFLKNKKY